MLHPFSIGLSIQRSVICMNNLLCTHIFTLLQPKQVWTYSKWDVHIITCKLSLASFIFRVPLGKKCTYKTHARKLISFYGHWPCSGILPVGNVAPTVTPFHPWWTLPFLLIFPCSFCPFCCIPILCHHTCFFQAPQSSFPLSSKPTAGQRAWCYSALPTFPSYCTEKKGHKKQIALLL